MSFTPKSPKGDFCIFLNFSVFPLGFRVKNTEIQKNRPFGVDSTWVMQNCFNH
jgi:hypothetical protein